MITQPAMPKASEARPLLAAGSNLLFMPSQQANGSSRSGVSGAAGLTVSQIFTCLSKHHRCLACIDSLVVAAIEDIKNPDIFPPRCCTSTLPLLAVNTENSTLGQLSLLARLSPATKAA
jgi:hypothetical protein